MTVSPPTADPDQRAPHSLAALSTAASPVNSNTHERVYIKTSAIMSLSATLSVNRRTQTTSKIAGRSTHYIRLHVVSIVSRPAIWRECLPNLTPDLVIGHALVPCQTCLLVMRGAQPVERERERDRSSLVSWYMTAVDSTYPRPCTSSQPLVNRPMETSLLFVTFEYHLY